MALTLQQVIELEGALDDAVAAITRALAPYSAETRARAAARFLKMTQLDVEAAVPKSTASEPIGSTGSASESQQVSPSVVDKHVEDSDGTLVYEKLHRLLQSNPGMSFDDMATLLYGEANKETKQSIRTQLNKLRIKGMAKSNGSGFWEAVSATPRRRMPGGTDK
jgi:hypothetical protein